MHGPLNVKLPSSIFQVTVTLSPSTGEKYTPVRVLKLQRKTARK